MQCSPVSQFCCCTHLLASLPVISYHHGLQVLSYPVPSQLCHVVSYQPAGVSATLYLYVQEATTQIVPTRYIVVCRAIWSVCTLAITVRYIKIARNMAQPLQPLTALTPFSEPSDRLVPVHWRMLPPARRGPIPALPELPSLFDE